MAPAPQPTPRRFLTEPRPQTRAAIRPITAAFCRRSLARARNRSPKTLTIDLAAVGHGLAARTPERNARIRALDARADRLAAAAAGLTFTAIHPMARSGVRLVRRAAPPAAISDESVARIFHHIGLQLATSHRDGLDGLLVREQIGRAH